jgi:hypothetical protein
VLLMTRRQSVSAWWMSNDMDRRLAGMERLDGRRQTYHLIWHPK